MAMGGLDYGRLLVICGAMAMVFICSSTTVNGGFVNGGFVNGGFVNGGLAWIPIPCKAAECLGADDFEFDSDISRRILATSQYISYGALQRNSVPCSRRGASYYNCQPGAQSNPYNRGCTAITRCRS